MSSLNGYALAMALLRDDRFTHAEARFLAKAVEHADQFTGRVHLSSEGIGQRSSVKSHKVWAAAIAKAHQLGFVSELTIRDVIVDGLVRTQKDWSFALSVPTGGAEDRRGMEAEHRETVGPAAEADSHRKPSRPAGTPGILSTGGSTGGSEDQPSTSYISTSLISTSDCEEGATGEGREGACEEHPDQPADHSVFCLARRDAA